MRLKELFLSLVNELDQASVYHGHGVVDAEDEVVLLLMHVMALDFEALNQSQNIQVDSEHIDLARSYVSQRIEQRRPMAYVLGHAYFAGLVFSVDERVLIPRSPFVQLIDVGFEPWLQIDKVSRVLDLCTGSGCIGLALAHHFSHCHVTLSDLSEGALEVAEANRQALSLQDNTQCVQSDLFEEVSGSFDLIVTNPPYVSEVEYLSLPEEFGHEPKLALVSSGNGLDIPVKILAQASRFLNEGGWLFLEVGFYDQVLTEALPEVPFVWLEFDFEGQSLGDGQGICVFSRKDLLNYQPHFDAYLNHVS